MQDSLSTQRLQWAISRPANELGLPSPGTWGSAAGHQAEESEQVLPGLWAATVAWEANSSTQWDTDIPGRAPGPPWSATPEDNVVLRKRQRQGDTPSRSNACAAEGPRPAGQPGKRGADTPPPSEDIQRVGNDLPESGEDSPIVDFAQHHRGSPRGTPAGQPVIAGWPMSL